MKLGVIALNVLHLQFEEGLKFLQRLGVRAIEVGCAGFHNLDYCNPDLLLHDRAGLDRWLDAFARHEIEISALSAHGAPLSPDPDYAAEQSRRFRQACRLAEVIGVQRITLLAGLPEGAPGDRTPCWVVAPFPGFQRDVYRWQWEERVLPYWKEHARIAEDHGVLLCFEPQLSDVVYNPVALMQLREALGPVVGCCLDPSHLMYQGIDVIETIHYLGDAIYHVHVKDVLVHPRNARIKGMLDPSPLFEPENRSWSFTLPGWGHDEQFWRAFVTALRLVGYDDVLSIEMEAEYIELSEGIEKAVNFLGPLILERPIGRRWWEHANLSV